MIQSAMTLPDSAISGEEEKLAIMSSPMGLGDATATHGTPLALSAASCEEIALLGRMPMPSTPSPGLCTTSFIAETKLAGVIPPLKTCTVQPTALAAAWAAC